MEIDVLKLKDMRDTGESYTLLDVREPHEIALCKVAGSVDIPMQQVPQRLAELPREGTIVVMCHHGGRSLTVTNFLRQNGFGAINLAGGIDAWARMVEPGMARY
ncbi:rhodanese-like domain-containing protein [Emcibacter sp. SYSU 3D8]|uniref:rhodanese-like domain-containing protein n=1 Tax=Emcibacter sp. SYSU 3D8 TaxID=3133969 RepID=UPI0031FE906B